MEEVRQSEVAAALKRGWVRVAALLAALTALLCTETVPLLHCSAVLPKPLKAAAFRLLRVAEALVRRLLFLMACSIDPRGAGRRDGRSGPAFPTGPVAALGAAHGPGAGPPHLQIPAFRLFEPQPGFAAFSIVPHAMPAGLQAWRPACAP